MTFNLRIALLGLLTFSAGVNLAGCQSNKACGAEDGACCVPEAKETPVAIDALPAPVIATVNQDAPRGRLVEAETCGEVAGQTCYCVEVENEGKTWEYCILADGSLRKKEIDD